MTIPVLDVRNLSVEFKTDSGIVQAIDHVSFQVQPGQTLGIVGESGSGKSVSCLAAMGLIPTPGQITGGEIWFHDRNAHQPIDLLKLSPKQLQRYRGGQIGMIFQEPISSLNPVYTCGFQIMEAIRHHDRVSEAEARRRAVSLLQEVQILASDAELKQQCYQEQQESTQQLSAQALSGQKRPAQNPDVEPERSNLELSDRALQQQVNQRKQSWLKRYPHELSGGQMQRVMIAIALSCNPSLLIADEPTTALDVTVQAAILNLLRELGQKRDMSLIFVSHDLGVIAEIADVVAVMYQGKIVESGSVHEIFHNPKHPYTKGLLACRPRLDHDLDYLPTIADFMNAADDNQSPLPSSPEAKAESTIQGLKPANSSSNAQADGANLTASAPIPPTPILQVHDLVVTFPIKGVLGQTKRYVKAVDRVSFEIFAGETLGLVGESGCGKTTLARTILCLVKPRSGQIIFEGEDIVQLSERRLRRLRQHLQIVFQNPYSSLDPRMTVGAAVMEPMLIHTFNRNNKNHRDRAAYLLERVGIGSSSMKRYPHEFSGGQRQRICIARALALNPRFIICDESVSALDVSVQARVLNLLKELQQEFGLTYIFISHDLSVVKFMSDRIMVMNQGKIEEIAPASTLYTHPQKDYTRKLIAAIPKGEVKLSA